MRCPECPFAAEKSTHISCQPGEGVVGFVQNGSIEYAYVAEDNPSHGAGVGMIARKDVESYIPEIAEAIHECQGPIDIVVSREGLLGRLGLKQSRIECPVVNKFELQDSNSLREYVKRTQVGMDNLL